MRSFTGQPPIRDSPRVTAQEDLPGKLRHAADRPGRAIQAGKGIPLAKRREPVLGGESACETRLSLPPASVAADRVPGTDIPLHRAAGSSPSYGLPQRRRATAVSSP